MADRSISNLDALTTPASGDLLPIVDISETAASSKNKRITVQNLMSGMPDGTVTSAMIANGAIVNADINASAGIADTKLATIATPGKVSNSATSAASANTPSTIVVRDGSGSLSPATSK